MEKNPIRKLARSLKWQSLYSRAKELNIQLFDNIKDFSDLQVMFLQYLEFYHNLYVDLYLNEPMISEEVIENDLWADSYISWKKKNRDKTDKDNNNNKKNFTTIPKITFVQGKKRNING